MAPSRLVLRGLLLLMLSLGMLAAPIVLTVMHTGDVRAAQPAITASNALQPPAGTATRPNAAGNFVSYKAAPPQAPLTNIVISEFRTTGPNGGSDEFIELFNPAVSGTLPIAIGGWSLWRSDCSGGEAQVLVTATDGLIPAGTSLSPGQHYLIGGTTYSDTVTPDLAVVDIGVVDNGGIALRSGAGNTDTIVDQVGFCAVGPGDYSEGTPLSTVLNGTNESYERKFGGSYGSCLDNTDNATDFAVIAPSRPESIAGGSAATPCIYPTISGNAGVAGATLGYVEGLTTAKTSTSDASGNYTIQVAGGWSGTVTPSLAGYSFTPANASFTNLVANVTQNYAAVAAGPTATPDPWPVRSVVINEVGWAGTGAATTDEWIELYHPGSGTVFLEGWRLLGVRAGGVIQFDITLEDTDTDTISIGSGGYLVLTANDSVFSNNVSSTWTVPTPTAGTFGLIDTGMTLYLYDPSGETTAVDTANLALGGVVGAWPAGSTSQRRSMERINSGSPDSQTNWATFSGTPSGSSWPEDADGNLVYGSPGRANQVLTVTVTPSPVPTATSKRKPTPIPPTPYAHVVINEFLPRAGSDWNQDGTIDVFDEFIELKNLGPIDVDLKNWKLDDDANSGSSPYTLPSKKLKPGERAVYYHSTTSIALPDSGGNVRLLNPTGIVFDGRGYGPVEKPDVSHCRIPDGYYWKTDCFPTPGLENSQTGTAPSAPPRVAAGPPPCLLADSVPAPFREAECGGYGSNAYDRNYWDQLAGQDVFPVPDFYSKAATTVE